MKVESCVLHGAETCVPYSRLSQALEAIEMSCWRRCCKLTKLANVVGSTIRDNIGKRKLIWHKHVRRMPENR